MPLFYFFAAILILLGLRSLRGGIRFVRYVQREQARDYPEFTPAVSLVVPCRGPDQNLRENIGAIFRQDYPSYEIVFVSDRADDPALSVVEEARQAFKRESGPLMRVVIAGQATDSGQKVHNLQAAVREVDPKSEVLAFADTDAQPDEKWLRSLVAPLQDKNTGATTGYRWFVPVAGGFASHLRSVWNASIASALGARSEKNFCWGGSTAIRRQTFDRLNVPERWRGTVSDDFALTQSLREAKLAIRFVPACLIPSFEDCSLRELLEFTTRQLKVTRAYASHLWQAVLASSLIFVVVFFSGIILTLPRAAMGLSFATPLALLLIIFALGAMKAHLRLRAIELLLPEHRALLRRSTLAHLLLWPLAQVLYLYNSLAAAFSRRIRWRGIVYELKSPTETVIIQRGAK